MFYIPFFPHLKNAALSVLNTLHEQVKGPSSTTEIHIYSIPWGIYTVTKPQSA